jgi:hypothetical protein
MDTRKTESEGDKMRIICLILILCLIPVPASAFSWQDGQLTEKKTWPEFKAEIIAADKFLHTEDGRQLVLVGILAAGWVWARFIKGPAKYIYKNGKFRPYNPKKHLFLILPENT